MNDTRRDEISELFLSDSEKHRESLLPLKGILTDPLEGKKRTKYHYLYDQNWRGD